MKIAVYTCITGGYDTVKVPARTEAEIDYLLFTDDLEAGVPPWRSVAVENARMQAAARSRFAKLQPHRIPALSAYPLTIYVDGSIRIVGDLRELAGRCWNGSGDLFLYENPFRDCVYEEALECVRLGHASIFAIARQMRGYRDAGLPRGAGLFEANVIVRRANPAVSRLMDLWWSEYMGGARRDQLSLSYSAWRCGLPITSLGRSDPRFDHRYFELAPHRAAPFPRRARIWNRINRLALQLAPALADFG